MFRIAFYEKEITPPLGCFVPGFLHRLSDNVKDRLMAKAMVAESNGETVAFMVIDGCLFEKHVRNMVVERIEKFTGIKPENVFFTVNHTHTGIPVDNLTNGDVEIGSLDAIENQREYYTVFSKLMADCVILAHKRLEDCEMTFARGYVDGISFCRDYFMKNSTPQTNPAFQDPNIIGPTAEIDKSIPVLFVYGTDGTPKGMMLTYDCHLDCIGGNSYSGDYPAVISRIMKDKYGEDFVTVFFMGVAGNANHFNMSQPASVSEDPLHYRHMGQLLADEILRIEKTAEKLKNHEIVSKFEIIRLKRREVSQEDIDRAKHIIETVKEIPDLKITADNFDADQYALAGAKRLMKFIENTPLESDIPLQVFKLGEFKFYAFPGEPFSHFGDMLKQGSGTDKRMIATMPDQTIGYIVPKDLIYDTIYESRPTTSTLQVDAGYIIVDKLIEMGK